jgi:predicted alpha/beta superfamily hydrolase
MIRTTIWSPQLRNRRDVDIYLPTNYQADARRRYAVVYMQDGQNLADPSVAFAGTWHMDEVMDDLEAHGLESIVVGVHNTGDRLREYSPFPDPRRGGGDANRYLAFVADTVKPRIDRRFRTRRQPSSTIIAGSSMGGLLSIYAWVSRPDVFGHAGALSPSLWFGRERLFEYVEAARLPRGRLYLDVGTREGAEALADVRAMKTLLGEKAIGERMDYREDRGGRHDEASWSRRAGWALEFLLRA